MPTVIHKDPGIWGDHEILQWAALKQTCVRAKRECKVTSEDKVVTAQIMKECRQGAKI